MRLPAQRLVDKRQKSEVRSIKKTLLSFVYCLMSNGKGFTLVEVLVAITILATLVGGVLLSLNPIAQISKGQDAERVSDLQAIKTALDLYYSDNKCYPRQNPGIPFGEEWRVQNENGIDTVYMKEVPQDPLYKDSSSPNYYIYRTDDSVCPQWNVVFAQLNKNSSLANTCALSSLSDCAPSGYTGSAYACTMSGAVNCDNLAAASIVSGAESISPTQTPTPMPSATPTPTPPPPNGTVTYNFSNQPSINPDIYQAMIMPLAQVEPLGQAIRVYVDDANSAVTTVKVLLISDGDGRIFNLTRTGGTPTAGVWEGAWQVTDTYCDRYGYEITATDAQGSQVKNIVVDTTSWCQ